jgi:hypothetical protein
LDDEQPRVAVQPGAQAWVSGLQSVPMGQSPSARHSTQACEVESQWPPEQSESDWHFTTAQLGPKHASPPACVVPPHPATTSENTAAATERQKDQWKAPLVRKSGRSMEPPKMKQ